MRVVGDAVGMGGDAAVEDEDLPPWENLAQMVVGASVAEAELDHRARDVADQARRRGQAVALGDHAPDEGI